MAFILSFLRISILFFFAQLGMTQGSHALENQPIEINPDVFLQQISENVWVHTTYMEFEKFGRFPSNGLIVIDGDTAAMIDTPCKDDQTGLLFDWVQKNLHATIQHVIPTHWHIDCMGGLAEAHRRNATSYSLDQTREIAQKKELPLPQKTFQDSYTLKLGNTILELRYLGAGHTVDNIVVWLPQTQILFGGCLIKSANSTSLGNLEDAVVDAWPQTLRKVLQAFPTVTIVVPGHGGYGDKGLISHTLKLSEDYLSEKAHSAQK